MTLTASAKPVSPRPSAAHRTWRTLSPYAYIAPFFTLFAAFGLFPLIYTAFVSLYRVELQTPGEMQWRGFGNYTALFGDEIFWTALRNTFTIGVLSTVPQLVMALGLAHLLNYRLRGRTFLRTAMLLPYATSVAAATLVFAQLFGRDFGLINYVLGLVGFGPVDWQAGTVSSQIAVSTIVIWRWTGYNALIYLAGMQSIPSELYEAAEMDGASRWRQFVHVTLPGLRPTILFTVVVSTIGATQLFGEPLLFEGSISGGISHQYQTLGLYMYEQGWGFFHLGRAAAIAWVMFLLILVLVGVNALIARRRSRKEAGR
ncbi:sugar ABC transporter permease [Streptomyces lunaelactis]|uniref:carbohydrate ABC transporter permease n=1 Tax=Streptomyces lunaelactis TaxID=1535768 RepID=UPI001584BB79|nr:sugar ABC transporter permease [Streptomyces lunaelactis]NUK03159.1 sugar ABC transporter permease [Streptomyces lunaelactis]NUK09914.1 sugar ABC transporter permease [Streptomyces lunaelactis]NUK15089.1 sugar ABC transporter permease [Streptomyces lunaelactis]NUK24544.1 sugar ABC transporter permease [Streptomyces lunaelactis]NUK36269.1 sugar ABC transporter permease [Streptomyces lunaelactis]